MIKNIIFILIILDSSTLASTENYSINKKLNLNSSISIENIKIRDKIKNNEKFSFSSTDSIKKLYQELN